MPFIFINKFLFAAALVMICNISCAKKTTSTVTRTVHSNSSIALNPSPKDILYYVNQHRRSKGLAPLQLLDAITREATNHSNNMALRRTAFGHNGMANRVINVSKTTGPVKRSGENVANGSMTANEVVAAWLSSAGHRKNIEGAFTHTGIGVAKDKTGKIFYTQIFIAK
jgi:uncharacterized protein YkwD